MLGRRRLSTNSRRRVAVPAVLALAATAVLATGSASAAVAATSAHRPAGDTPVVLFSSDGMRPDLMQRYAGQGLMPTYASLMRTGATGDNGLTQGFPPNTGQGWYTMATGAWPGRARQHQQHLLRHPAAVHELDVVLLPRQRRQPRHRSDQRAGGAVGGVVGRAGRQEGRAARMDRRAQRQHQRADRRLRDVLLAARRAELPGRHDQAGLGGELRPVLPDRGVHAGGRLDERAVEQCPGRRSRPCSP